jgi:hypothetical protein
MRNLLAFLAAAVLVVAGLGWYLNWYKIDTTSGLGGHKEVKIDINGRKVKADVQKGAEAGAEELQDVIKKQNAGEGVTIQPKIVVEPGSAKSPPSGQ